ncbi:HEAT repeat domain-containing protein [Nocardia sp. CDC160]|uniref:HEAT repeat domain-containing protein n=1 Tax=Nocardia sp. CDC160 TaxID=3112166 RepID=UPI002DBA138F|nr:HEAT repeat domain-containing protein [Nocardia sp. CDC160]MEC3919287.1 HEAT repeat domain-containing protein [Nocardia sp. CDC160]
MTGSQSLEALITRLGGDDPVIRAEAADYLLRDIANAAPRLIATLRQLSTRAWADPRAAAAVEALVDLLGSGGDVVLDPLVAAVPAAWAADRADAEKRWCVVPPWALKSEVLVLHRVFENLSVSDDAKYLPLLRDREPLVRWWGLWALARSGSAASRFLDVVLPLVDDRASVVSNRAFATLDAMGSEALAKLRELGQEPGPAQGPALSAVAALGGWPLLDSTQRALLTQRVEDKVAHEAPQSMWVGGLEPNWRGDRDLMGDWTGDWLAVPTNDQTALLDALGLVEAMPTTMQKGMHISINVDCVYITPQLDGWTLVFGYVLPDGISVDSVRECVVGLSRRFGSAQCYGFEETWAGWALAEHGELVRLRLSGEFAEAEEQIGPPHPAELDAGWQENEPHEYPGWSSTSVAHLMSLNPRAIGSHTRVRGHGLVADTSAQWHQSLTRWMQFA